MLLKTMRDSRTTHIRQGEHSGLKNYFSFSASAKSLLRLSSRADAIRSATSIEMLVIPRSISLMVVLCTLARKANASCEYPLFSRSLRIAFPILTRDAVIGQVCRPQRWTSTANRLSALWRQRRGLSCSGPSTASVCVFSQPKISRRTLGV